MCVQLRTMAKILTVMLLLCTVLYANGSALRIDDHSFRAVLGKTLGSTTSPSTAYSKYLTGKPKVISGGCYLKVCDSISGGEFPGRCQGNTRKSTDFVLSESTPLAAEISRPDNGFPATGVSGWVCTWTRVANNQSKMYFERHVVLTTDGKV
jgi:hypothetical protein